MSSRRRRSESPPKDKGSSSAAVAPVKRKTFCGMFGCSGTNNTNSSGPNSTLAAFSRATKAPSASTSLASLASSEYVPGYVYDEERTRTYLNRKISELRTINQGGNVYNEFDRIVTTPDDWDKFENEFIKIKNYIDSKAGNPRLTSGTPESRLYPLLTQILELIRRYKRPTYAEIANNRAASAARVKEADFRRVEAMNPVNYSKTIYGQRHDMPIYSANGRTILGYTPNQSRWTEPQRQEYRRETERLKSVGESRPMWDPERRDFVKDPYTREKIFTSNPGEWHPGVQLDQAKLAAERKAVENLQRARYAPLYRGGKPTRKSSRKQRSKKQSKKRKH
jgi:hypothetical protein